MHNKFSPATVICYLPSVTQWDEGAFLKKKNGLNKLMPIFNKIFVIFLFKLKNAICYVCANYLAPFIDIFSKRYGISKFTFVE